jgi:1-phosphatidylinositol-3-phosphate 5-kinase
VFGAEENVTTPTVDTRSTSRAPDLPNNSPRNPAGCVDSTTSNTNSEPRAPKHPIIDGSERLLVSLRQNFQQIERSLYSQLAKIPDTSLNDIRRAFLFAGKGTQKRLKAWQDKHLGSAKSKVVGDLVADEPEWWEKGCHVVPNSNIIVRESDWGSIIAHTLRFVRKIFCIILELTTVV